MSNFLQRLLVGSALGAFFLWIIYVSHDPLLQPLFVLALALVIAASLWEYYRIAEVNGYQPVIPLGMLCALSYLIVLYATNGGDGPIITLALFLFAAFLFYFMTGISPLVNLAITSFGVIYLAIPLSLMMLINFDYGRYWMLYLLLVTKLTDVGAYFAGKNWGRHQLAPFISPKKTWEGALAGLLVGTLTSLILHLIALKYYAVPLFSSAWQSIYFGALMSAVAQIGDLSESLLKRDSGVKDSNKLPGLGGILDMVDSLVFTTPLLYYFLKLII